MDHLEKVEKLRAKANITYEEAKAVLEEAGGDLLDAMTTLLKTPRLPKKNPLSEKSPERKAFTATSLPLKTTDGIHSKTG